jgi:hypothetical protein
MRGIQGGECRAATTVPVDRMTDEERATGLVLPALETIDV